MKSYKELQIYQRGYEAAKACYRMTEDYPEDEIYGVTNQIRRAALSIPLNIAEGFAKRESQSEFKRYLMMAIGSANEMQVLIDFSYDLGYMGNEKYEKAKKEYEEIGKMISSFVKALKNNI